MTDVAAQTPTQAVCSTLLAATGALTAGEIADASGQERQKVATILWALEKAGALQVTKAPNESQLYTVKDQERIKKSATGMAQPGRKKRRKRTPEDKSKRDKKSKKRKAKKAAREEVSEAQEDLAYFIDAECDVTIMRADGEGEGTLVSRKNAVKLLAFLEQFRNQLEEA